MSLSVSIFSSCRGDSTSNFAYDLAKKPVNMDPQIASSSEENTVLANIMEGLLTYNTDGDIVGGVAKDYTVSDDGLVYTFNLRNDAKWVTNENEIYANVTANDFKYSFTRLFDPNIGSVSAYDFTAIKNGGAILRKELSPEQLGVDVINDYTLQITLEYDFPMFLDYLTTPPAMPCNQQFFIDTKGTYGLGNEFLLYNGPFYMSMWDNDSRVVLRSNSNYVSTDPGTVSTVTFFIPETISQSENEGSQSSQQPSKIKTPFENFEDGTTDAIILSADQIADIDTNKYPKQMFEDTSWLFFINEENDVLQNRNIRLALMHSLDKSLYEDMLPNSMTSAGALVPHIVGGVAGESYRQDFGEDMTVEYNPEIAKAYLNQGLADLGVFSFPKVTITYPENDYFTEILQNIQRQWQSELSIFINISPLPDAQVRENVAIGDYDIALSSIRSTSNSPVSILGQFSEDSTKNYVGYKSSIYNDLLLQAATNTNLYESYSLFSEAESTIIKDGVVCPLAFQKSSYLVGKNVKGVFFAPFGDIVYFKYGVIE